MSAALPVFPFDPKRAVGTTVEVGPAYAKVNLPRAASATGAWLHGSYVGGGEVGEFVVLECGEIAVFGRIIGIRLPERERLTVEPELGSSREAHPVGTVQLLSSVALSTGAVMGGILAYPRLGSSVFSAHPMLVKWVAEAAQSTKDALQGLVLEFASLPSAGDTPIRVTPERLFGRHCAVLGATGGGKSWTVAKLVEEATKHNSKVILFDATGEFHRLRDRVQHIHIGSDPSPDGESTEVVFPYSELTEADLFALFKPSGQTQAPKLRAAMKSLKLGRLEPSLTPDGVVVKAQKPKAPFEKAYSSHSGVVEAPRADFDVTRLTRQIQEECVWPTGGTASSPDPSRWGQSNATEVSYCISLITRIEDMLQSKDLACVFQPQDKTTFSAQLAAFLGDSSRRALRVSLKHLPFAHNAREIVTNAIGRHILALARDGRFRAMPLLVFLDEAHQFLDKALGDESSRFPLDSFELIAKEGRKYCVNICISTQRPRDIPDGVLSQMGTLVVHRLTNDRDREVVERAAGEIDKSAAAFLPTLAPGQAVIIGVDFAIPLTVQVTRPAQQPDSRGPDYQTNWRISEGPGQGTEEQSGEIQPASSEEGRLDE